MTVGIGVRPMLIVRMAVVVMPIVAVVVITTPESKIESPRIPERIVVIPVAVTIRVGVRIGVVVVRIAISNHRNSRSRGGLVGDRRRHAGRRWR